MENLESLFLLYTCMAFTKVKALVVAVMATTALVIAVHLNNLKFMLIVL